MAIKLGNNPETFKKTITLTDMDGKDEKLNIEFKYRTRLQFAALMDERDKADKEREQQKELEQATAPKDDAPSYQQQLAEALEVGTDRVLEIAQGWDLTDPFTKENLAVLEGMFPHALGEIQNAYQAAVLERRQKN